MTRYTIADIEKAGRILERESTTVPPELIREMVAATTEKKEREQK